MMESVKLNVMLRDGKTKRQFFAFVIVDHAN
jgi:hypothetical protein